MDVKNFLFRENQSGSKMTGMKTPFLTNFDTTWFHIFAQKSPNKEFLKQCFFNWDSLHARLNSYGVARKKKTQKD